MRKLPWLLITGAALVVATAFSLAFKQHAAAKKYTNHRTEYCSSLATTLDQRKACLEESSSTRDYLPWWYLLVEWPEGITVWAVIVTGFVVAWQSYETRKAAAATEQAVIESQASRQLAENTAKRELRAYMALRQGRLFILDGGVLRMKLEIENFGQTPAYAFQGAHRIGLFDYPVNVPLDPEANPRSKAIVGPQRASYFIENIWPTEQEIEALRGLANKALLISARFTYLDIFKEPHYLWLQVGIGGPMGVRIDKDESGRRFYHLAADSEGNEAD